MDGGCIDKISFCFNPVRLYASGLLFLNSFRLHIPLPILSSYYIPATRTIPINSCFSPSSRSIPRTFLAIALNRSRCTEVEEGE